MVQTDVKSELGSKELHAYYAFVSMAHSVHALLKLDWFDKTPDALHP